MAIINKFNVNKQQVTLDADIIENMSANDVSYNASTQYNENTVGNKLSKLESEIDVFKEDVTDEVTVFKETVTEQVNNYKPIVINGNVTNAQDEEDLTSVDGLLKFKNRSALNGMGYVILRKDKSFSEQVTLPNTIYEIRYNFDLKGKTQSIPSNCVLHFVGGIISNGIISGNNTTIDGAEYGAFDSVKLSGRFTNIESNLSWWGCVPFDVNNQYDNSSKINDAFRSTITRVGVSRIYGVSKPIDISNSVVGISDVPGYKFCGFYANSDFSPITITLPRDNKTYEVNGMFYHYYDEHPSIENLTIDLRYCAKYAIEHIAGYSNIELSNVNIYNALVAGILQYGCEKMTWNTLLVKGCRCGAIISTNKIDEDDPFLTTTTHMGMPNMVVLEHCRFVGGNYGLICRGGSNYKLDSCETAHNSLFGLILLSSTYLITNYYSENDCLSNFWIDNNGLISYPNSDGGVTDIADEWDKGKVHPYLIENNIDGILCQDGGILESSPYMRSVIYVNGANINLVSPFFSIKPRSYEVFDVKIDARELPTERNASGIDALIILEPTHSIILKNISVYCHANDTGTVAFTDIVMKVKDLGSYVVSNHTSVSSDGNYQVRLWYDGFPSFGNFNECRLTYSVNGNRDFVKRLIDIKPTNMAYEDLNSDQDSWQYGTSQITPYKYHSLKGYVKNVPVYKRDTSRPNYNNLNFTKAQSLSKFGDRMQIKCKFVAYIPEDVTSRIKLDVSFRNTSYGIINSYVTDMSGDVLIKAGYYELTTIVPVRPKESEFDNWARTLFTITVNNEPTIDVYVSNIYFFDIGDGSEICDNKTPILVSGGTDLRPYLPFVGQSYFDTTIGKSIVWTGSKWVDTTGADV